MIQSRQEEAADSFLVCLFVVNYLCDTNGTDFNGAAALDNINRCIRDWTCPQVL